MCLGVHACMISIAIRKFNIICTLFKCYRPQIIKKLWEKRKFRFASVVPQAIPARTQQTAKRIASGVWAASSRHALYPVPVPVPD